MIDLSKTIDILKENVSTRLAVMDGDMKDLNIKMLDTSDRFTAHTKSVNLTMEKEFQRIEKVTRKYEQILQT